MQKSVQSGITHEQYFDKHNLSVEQYGEILVKIAFGGTKMLNNNKGYDIRDAIIDGEPGKKIEVKSKVNTGPNGRASVVHCGEKKLGPDGMTHLAVVLMDRKEYRMENEPSVKEAWLLTEEQARGLRRQNTKSKYINVGELRKVAKTLGEIKSITEKLREAAQSVA
jgi:hypothetical protein